MEDKEEIAGNGETKKLLELLEKALSCENVERITITIKPDKKPKRT